MEKGLISELKEFLKEANMAGYAGGEEKKWKKEEDNSTTITHESSDGRWLFHDNFFGGEPYGGREVIFKDGQAVWMMVYYGEIVDKGLDKDKVYAFLQKSLSLADEDLPVRGPKEKKEEIDGGEWFYENNWQGSLERFKGKEIIKINGKEIYNADYIGGLVDIKNN